MKSFALIALVVALSLTLNETASAADTYAGHYGNLGHGNIGLGHGYVGHTNTGRWNVHSGYGYQTHGIQTRGVHVSRGGHGYLPQNGHGVYRGAVGHGYTVPAYGAGHGVYGNLSHGNSLYRSPVYGQSHGRGLRISAPHFGLRIGH